MDEFKAVVGKILDFYGVSKRCFRIGTPGEKPVTFEVIEDDEDGLVSRLSDVILVPNMTEAFPLEPVSQVMIRPYIFERFDGFEIVDVGCDHQWVYVGTDSTHEHYSLFVFEYRCPAADILES